MKSTMQDCRALVPRQPPAGLAEWAAQQNPELCRHGLLYEIEWARDFGLAQLLDEWGEPKRVKMVRVTCSCCQESILLDWGYDKAHGYGFIHPDDEEGDYSRTVTAEGDEASCPICGEPVKVYKKASASRTGYVVAAETSVMSAGLVGSGLLALTGWNVQRRVYKSGCTALTCIPAEAYVFSAHDCAQLMGWRNAYSGNAGYFISYSRSWRQPGGWAERWGREEEIFGLTPELVERSCLPHCKLDVYMEKRPGAKHYPVLYLRMYQEHHNVESLLLRGLPRVLDELIDVGYKKSNHPFQGLLDIPEIDWTERRPAQMLHLTKEELRMAREQSWGGFLWRLFTGAKEAGERLTKEDIRNAFQLGDETVLELAGRGPIAKSIRYLLRQYEYAAPEDEDEDPALDDILDAQMLLDYWDMAKALGRNLNDLDVRFPPDLLEAHNRVTELMKEKEKKGFAAQFRVRRRQLRRYAFAADGLLIVPAGSQAELAWEGDSLHHCVSTYGKKHAAGKTAIFFIRRAANPREPYFTLEFDEKTLTVRQNRGRYNCGRTPEVQAFEEKWLAWVRAGCKRDAAGRPLPEKERGAA